MDKTLEKAHARKVLNGLAKAVRPLGFERTKTTFFTRSRGSIVEFFHVHKHSFDSSFRVHLGLRVANDASAATHLNGPDSHPYVCTGAPGGRKYNLGFHDAPATIDRCVTELSAFVSAIAEPWFQSWRELPILLGSQDSPGWCVAVMIGQRARLCPIASQATVRQCAGCC